ncbi:hypothetical protein AAFF_G00316320 [Aldrovandia affinis]|uniref:Uncharacterized protein n=1 Tax=Aldrovandia affinis TaxID=143900 RepID=A0AAD7SP92_9TELE|nr:hypothetical protein AAFF_G00316320 [Aldrovandia affinis]
MHLVGVRYPTTFSTDYAIEFRTLAVECAWNTEALLATFHHGLSEALKDDLATLIDVSIRIDNWHCERRRERMATPLLSPESWIPLHAQESSLATPRSPPAIPGEPMQLGATHI